MNKKSNFFKKIFFILLVSISVFGILNSSKNTNVDATGETEYLLKGDGTYLTYKGSSEKVLALKEYDYPTQEFRGCWVSHFAGDVSSYVDEESYKQEITKILDNMETWGMNALVFHIRTHNNALYQSVYNPVARWYSSVNFEEFDPIEWIIEECHKRGIEFHAWMNPYRVSDTYVFGDYPESNPANDSSNLLISSSGATILDPGSQLVRDFIVATCMEVVEKYDVDAIHFDDYFYINGVATNLSADEKRNNVDKFVYQLHNEMTEFNEKNNKNVQLGISPTGIYRNGSYQSSPTYNSKGNLVSPIGSNTSGQEHFNSYLYSDTLYWINEGWIDYITPQTYWGLEKTNASYASLTRWWSWAVENKNVNLYMGMGIYMAIEDSGSWNNDVNEVDKQLRNAGMYDKINGICVYKYSSLLDSNATVKQGVETIKTYWGSKKVPGAPQKSYANKVVSNPVNNLRLEDGNLVWSKVNDVRGYMVYKVSTGTTLDTNNIDHLLVYTQDTSVFANDTVVYDYYVSTVNRANVISTPVKFSSGEQTEKKDEVITRISLLPTNITLENEEEVNEILSLYNNLSTEDKAKVVNYNILEQAYNTIQAIKSINSNVTSYLKTIDKDLINGTKLVAPENMKWSYKNASDSSIYNLSTGKILKTTLARKITLVLTASIPNSNYTYSVDVEFNASVIPSKYTPLIYRNDASCMTPNDEGEYTESSKYIGWSNVILYVGNFALPIATTCYQEVTSVSEITKVKWTSCGALITNKSSSSISFSLLNNVFESSSNYGHFIISSNGKLKEISDTTDYNKTFTLESNESLFISRYLERDMKNTPFTAISSNFDTSTVATIVKYDDIISDTSEVESIIDLIDKLPTNITLDNEEEVNSIKRFYDSLSNEEKTLVTNYSKLESAISVINKLKQDAKQLNDAKEKAKNEINNYVKLSNYSVTKQALIKGYQQIYLLEIENATDVNQINSSISKYKEEVDKLSPLAEELEESKANAKKEIRSYLDLNNYTENGIEQINQIYLEADKLINDATGFDELNDIVKDTKIALDIVLDKDEELAKAKKDYQSEISTYYNEDDYSANIAEIIISKAYTTILEIGKANSIEEINNLVIDFKSFVADYIKNDEFDAVLEQKEKEMEEKIDKKYQDNEKVNNLLQEYKSSLKNAKTYSRMNTIIKNFEIELEALCKEIDSNNSVTLTCKKANTMLISLFSAFSLLVLVLRKKR